MLLYVLFILQIKISSLKGPWCHVCLRVINTVETTQPYPWVYRHQDLNSPPNPCVGNPLLPFERKKGVISPPSPSQLHPIIPNCYILLSPDRLILMLHATLIASQELSNLMAGSYTPLK